LIEAINDYQGAIILVSHDRHLLDSCADRLWLVEGGTVKPYDGDMDDYKRYVLDRASGGTSPRKSRAEEKARAEEKPGIEKPVALTPKAAMPLKKRIAAAEDKMKKFQDLLARVDKMLADPDAFVRDPIKAKQLSQQRGDLERALTATEEEWLMLTSELEAG
jgi:ATP-binding cassette, subfamily F, member 3